MSYTVKFRDKTEIMLSTQRGEKLKAILTQAKPPTMVEIEDKLTRVAEILSVDKVYEPEARVHQPANWGEVLELTGGKRCRGQQSIQNEINNIAKGEGDGWQQRIRDKKWREATRLTLREANPDGWCDYREEECSCK